MAATITSCLSLPHKGGIAWLKHLSARLLQSPAVRLLLMQPRQYRFGVVPRAPFAEQQPRAALVDKPVELRLAHAQRIGHLLVVVEQPADGFELCVLVLHGDQRFD